MDEQVNGTVTATRGRRFAVRLDNGDLVQCEVRRKVKHGATGTPVAVGDKVNLTVSTDSTGIIESVEPRRSSFHRPGVGSEDVKQVIAANIDRLAIVVSIKSPALKTGLIDRFLIAAFSGSLEPFIVINKTDLGMSDEIDEIVETYRDIDIPVFLVSAESGEGLGDLKRHLDGHLSIFVGHSGVGKTSILNQLIPEINLKTRDVSAYTNRGKHTTTAIELYKLPSGGFFVDSPGLKVMGLWEVSAADLPSYYPEFEAYLDQCRFSPCSHSHEPKCAVKKAVENDEIAAFRYDNYVAISASLSDPDSH